MWSNMINLPPMTLFDSLVSTRENLMLKTLLPYLNKDFQPFLALYIKYSELMATINLFKGNNKVFNNSSPDIMDIITNILPYLSPEDQQTFENMGNLKNMMDIFEQYKDFSTMAGMDTPPSSNEDSSSEKDTTTNANNTSNTTDEITNTNDILSAFLSPEQQQLFQFMEGIK